MILLILGLWIKGFDLACLIAYCTKHKLRCYKRELQFSIISVLALLSFDKAFGEEDLSEVRKRLYDKVFKDYDPKLMPLDESKKKVDVYHHYFFDVQDIVMNLVAHSLVKKFKTFTS